MATNDVDVLKELQNISFLLGDLNCIRHGEYEPPRGADPNSKRVIAHPDDIYNKLSSLVGLMERQTILIYNMGKVLCDTNNYPEDHWENLNSQF